jgi:DNA-binding response OmpR family regulator
MREALQAILACGGYQLAFAPDGPQGLARAAELYPDLILLDVMMPGMDGFEVCRRLKADPTLSAVYVVMVTGTHADADRKVEGLELGADDCLMRPLANREPGARSLALALT